MKAKERYLSALNRLDRWEKEATQRNRETVLDICGEQIGVCHNRKLDYEQGKQTITTEQYKRIKRYDWKQNQIRETKHRLNKAFYLKYLWHIGNS